MDDDVIRIPLLARDGSVRAWAIVDREDGDLAEWRWSLDTDGYAMRMERGRNTQSGFARVTLHRVILSRATGRVLSGDEHCDHSNMDKLDDRRANLRVATRGQNAANRKGRGASPYLGVHRQGAKWQARISPIGSRRKYFNLGAFADEADAARAYDRAAREHHGEYARLNFPDGGDA